MAVCRAFSSVLITAHRQWWKAVVKWRRHCVVFSLSFDYIPNYSASKQLNAAWMLWTDSAVELCCFTYCAAQSEMYPCMCECASQRTIWWKRGFFFFFFREAVKPALITRVNSITMTSSFMAWMIPWCHDLSSGVCVHTWGREKAFFENRPVL